MKTANEKKKEIIVLDPNILITDPGLDPDAIFCNYGSGQIRILPRRFCNH
jgi:hypothetical protein